MKRVGDVIPGFLENIGLRDDRNYGGFVSAWKELIGDELFWHSRPIDIKGPLLIVAVDHPGWMARIRFTETALLRKVQKRFPQLGISSLAFTLVAGFPKPQPIVQAAEQLSVATEPIAEDVPESGDGTNAPAEKLQSALERLKQAMKNRKANGS